MTACTRTILEHPLTGRPGCGVYDRARERLAWRETVWQRKPLLRTLYRRYHEIIAGARSTVEGISLEIGVGHRGLAKAIPGALGCDIVPCPWLDCAADAATLPFCESSLANIIMIDVLHHLEQPLLFLAEAARTLAPGGRILLLEPYVSPVSGVVWRRLHEEDVDMSAQPLLDRPTAPRAKRRYRPRAGWHGCTPSPYKRRDPWEANTAIPTLLFWRDLEVVHGRFPSLRVIRRDRFDLLLYPLSGGFGQRQWVPTALVPIVRACERVLAPLAGLLAFRCFVVVEKVLDGGSPP